MKTLVRLLIFVILLAAIGGVAFLATWDIPAPTAPVEREIPTDQFPR